MDDVVASCGGNAPSIPPQRSSAAKRWFAGSCKNLPCSSEVVWCRSCGVWAHGTRPGRSQELVRRTSEEQANFRANRHDGRIRAAYPSAGVGFGPTADVWSTASG